MNLSRSIALALSLCMSVAVGAAEPAQSAAAPAAVKAPAESPTKSPFMAYEQSLLAFTHADVVDGTGAPIRRDQTLLIKDGKIRIGRERACRNPEGRDRDRRARGKTLLPGLVMMHEHMFYPTGHGNYSEMVHSFRALYLARGVTTLRTAGAMLPYADLNMRAQIQAGAIAGPDMDVTAQLLNGATRGCIELARMA